MQTIIGYTIVHIKYLLDYVHQMYMFFSLELIVGHIKVNEVVSIETVLRLSTMHAIWQLLFRIGQ